MKENLTVIRNILFKSFLIGYIILIFSALIFMFNVDYFADLANQMFGIERQYYLFAVMLIMGMAKNVLFLAFLCPAIAIHWTLKCKCECKK
jgi:hypothetical protein